MEKAIQKAIEGGWEPVDFTDMPIENRGLLFFDDFPADTKEDVDKDHVYFYDTEYPEEGYYASMLMELAVLDPSFWKALGKSLGWEKQICKYCGNSEISAGKEPNTPNGDGEYYSNCKKCGADWLNTEEFEEGNAIAGYLYHWHSFIDHLAEGGNVDEFFNKLLK